MNGMLHDSSLCFLHFASRWSGRTFHDLHLRTHLTKSDLLAIKEQFGHKSIKVIPKFCIAHSYCARFLRHQRAHISARVQNIRDFPQTKLDSEIKAPFLLNKHGDPHFLFYKLNENNIRNK